MQNSKRDWISLGILVFSLLVAGCQKHPSTKIHDPIKVRTNQSQELERWPNLFGPDHQSQIQDKDLPSILTDLPIELWRVPVGTGYSSPVLAKNRLFLSHRQKDEEIIECFSTTTGSSLWRFSFPAKYECQYEYSSGPYSTIVLTDNDLIAVGLSGNTFCLSQKDGKELWRRDLFRDFEIVPGEWPVAASGIVVQDKFIFNLGGSKNNAGVIALNISSGETVWSNTNHEAGHATPNLLNVGSQTFVVMVTSNGLHSFDPESGNESWFLPFRRRKAETYNAVSPVVSENLICMVTGPGPGTMLVEVDPSNSPKILWQDRRILDSQYTNLLCVDDHLFGFTPMKQGGPELRCIDMLDHKLCWKQKAKLGRGMMVLCNKTIIVLGENGNLSAIELSNAGFNELFRTPCPVLEAPCYTAPAIYDSKLFLRNERHLVCLQLQ